MFLRIKTIKATNAVQMLYSISSSKLHHTSGQWFIVISNFLLFNKYNWRAKRTNLVVLCARFFSIYIYIYTSMKNHFYKMKRDIGMADYEKLVKQDFHTPSIEFHTPSLYLCFFL